MRMKLYRIAPMAGPELMVVAEHAPQAVEVAVTYSAALGRLTRGQVVIEQFDTLVSEDQKSSLDALLERGVPGVATYTDENGWSLKPPG